MEISLQQFFKANCWDHVSSTINVWLILLRNIATPSSIIMMSGIGKQCSLLGSGIFEVSLRIKVYSNWLFRILTLSFGVHVHLSIF